MVTVQCTGCNEFFKTTNKRAIETIHHFCCMKCYGIWQKDKSFKEQKKTIQPIRTCYEENCNRKHYGKGFCRLHYYRKIFNRPPRMKHRIKCKYCGISFYRHSKKTKYCSHKCCSNFRKKPFIIKDKYKKILIPNHPRADMKGYVFEHIIILEDKLGRKLIKNEVCHHINHNRLDNHPDNLICCENNSIHIRKYHSASTVML